MLLGLIFGSGYNNTSGSGSGSGSSSSSTSGSTTTTSTTNSGSTSTTTSTSAPSSSSTGTGGTSQGSAPQSSPAEPQAAASDPQPSQSYSPEEIDDGTYLPATTASSGDGADAGSETGVSPSEDDGQAAAPAPATASSPAVAGKRIAANRQAADSVKDDASSEAGRQDFLEQFLIKLDGIKAKAASRQEDDNPGAAKANNASKLGAVLEQLKNAPAASPLLGLEESTDTTTSIVDLVAGKADVEPYVLKLYRSV